MSLKAIHIFVILLSILLLFFFGFWSIIHFQVSKKSLDLSLGIVSALAGILLVPYLVWFIMKLRRQTAR